MRFLERTLHIAALQHFPQFVKLLLLRNIGKLVNHKRVEPICREEGLKLPQKIDQQTQALNE